MGGGTPAPEDWERWMKGMRVVRLGIPLGVLVPVVAIASLSKGTRGLSLYPGRAGAALGVLLMASSALIGFLLLGPAGVLGTALALWLVGTAGLATLVAALRPTAFVKPICVACRLLPVIKEHEAIHLSGVTREREVWKSMKARHSVESLSLVGDPAICPFCPIPKRLSEY